MKVRVYINDNGAIVVDIDGKEGIMFYLDTMCEFPEDACEQMAVRLQELLAPFVPNDLTVDERRRADNLSLFKKL